MKVRLSEGMIRFRLDREQVTALSGGSPVRNTLPDKGMGVLYQLHPVAGEFPSADMADGFRVGLPSTWLIDWPDSEVVGFDFDVTPTLRVVVEKDFPCSHGDDKPAPPVRKP